MFSIVLKVTYLWWREMCAFPIVIQFSTELQLHPAGILFFGSSFEFFVFFTLVVLPSMHGHVSWVSDAQNEFYGGLSEIELRRIAASLIFSQR